MKKYQKFLIVSLLLSILAFILRFSFLGKLPQALHRDELSIAYNAYSIVKTGQDEYGYAWPSNFKAFGDYKLPGLIYFTALFLKLVPALSTFWVRFPSALLASLLVPISYFFVVELFKSKKIALWTMFFTSLSLWHIQSSRNIYEPVAALSLVVLALTFLLRARKRLVCLFPSIIVFTLSFLFYNVPLLLFPFFVIISLILFNENYKKHGIKFYLILFFLSGLSVTFLLKIVGGVNSSRSQTTLFYSQELIDKIFTQRNGMYFAGVPMFLSRLLVNKPLAIIMKFLKGYFAAFDITYLFFTGDHNAWHNLQNIGFGNLNLILLPLLSFTLISIFLKKKKNNKEIIYLLTLLLVSPIPDALTIDAPITNRLMEFHFFIYVLAAVGLDQFINSNFLNKKLKKSILFLFFTSYLAYFAFFLSRYLFVYNHSLAHDWQKEQVLIAQKTAVWQDKYEQIYISNQMKYPYIYFAFYHQLDPSVLQNFASRKQDGLVQADQFGKYKLVNNLQLKDINHKNIANYLNNNALKNLLISKVEYKDASQLALLSIANNKQEFVYQAEELTIDSLRKKYKDLPHNQERNLVEAYLDSCERQNCDVDILNQAEAVIMEDNKP